MTLLHSPYQQLVIVVGLLFLIMVFSRLASRRLLQFGMYVAIAWLIPGLVYSAFVTQFWWYLLNFFVSFILFYLAWIAMLVLCEKRGKAYLGNGWWGMLAPVYFLLILVFIAILAHGILSILK